MMLFQLAEELLSRGVDLLVLEGMGRAIHTNLYTKFKCECLKVLAYTPILQLRYVHVVSVHGEIVFKKGV
jgi:hypothetical protein